jgi:hypothetical protein
MENVELLKEEIKVRFPYKFVFKTKKLNKLQYGNARQIAGEILKHNNFESEFRKEEKLIDAEFYTEITRRGETISEDNIPDKNDITKELDWLLSRIIDCLN